MKILYISHMKADIAAGLTWSVPAGIRAQKRYDDVMWINLFNVHMKHWDATEVYYTLSNIGGSLRLINIPRPFCNPDVVVFEGFYSFLEVRFSWELRRKGIPYIIIPRGSLTKQAFHNHNKRNYLKKRIAALLLFKPFTRHALAIQFLTKQELADSGNGWSKHPIILPNGFDTPKTTKEDFSNYGLKIIYIGRPTIYQKGLDLLIEACHKIKQELKDNKLHISMYTPTKNDYKELVSFLKDAKVSEVLSLNPAVTGIEKERCLLQSDVFIMTSRFEGHPMGLIEALAYGLPVIVTHGTNMALEVSNADAGWVCECTVESLCTTLRKVISERSMLKEKSIHAKKLASKYKWDIIAQDFHNILDDLLY